MVLCSNGKQHKNKFSVLQRLMGVCMKRNFLCLRGETSGTNCSKSCGAWFVEISLNWMNTCGVVKAPLSITGLDYVSAQSM